ncbi:hypothetical protein GCM10027287_14320 [Bordetella muralis]
MRIGLSGHDAADTGNARAGSPSPAKPADIPHAAPVRKNLRLLERNSPVVFMLSPCPIHTIYIYATRIYKTKPARGHGTANSCP